MTGVSMTTWKSCYQNVENLRTLLQQDMVGVIIVPGDGYVTQSGAIIRPRGTLTPTLTLTLTLTLPYPTKLP